VSRFWNKVTGVDELRFGLTRKLLALIVIALGILTFFLPLVSVNPPVMSQTDWSAFDIVSFVSQGDLVRSSSDLQLFPVEIAIVYSLLLIAFYVVSIARSQRRLLHIGVVGIGLILYGWSRAANTFEVALYRNYPATEISPGQHVMFGDLMAAQLLVIGALLFLATSEFLDAGTPLKVPRPCQSPTKREPEFIHAEVVPDEEEEAPRTDQRLRLRN